MFHKKTIKMYNVCFPVKTLSVEQKYQNGKPWLTEGMKNYIKYKNKLYIKYKKEPNSFNQRTFTVFLSNLNKILRKSERDYYDNLLTEYKSYLRNMWSVINEIINKRKHKPMTSKFVVGDREIYDSIGIAEHFNNFFTNVAKNLAAKIPDTTKEATSYIEHSNINYIFLGEVSSDEISKVINCLKDTSSGWDDLNSKIVKSTSRFYIAPLTYLINLSLTQGVFPKELKIAKVISIYKSGDCKTISNNRPISVLSVFSKVFECITYNIIFPF